MNELVQGDLDSVEQDFTLHYHVTETKQFLDKLLPVDIRTVVAILQFMKDENIYDSQTQRWSGFPVPTHQENGSRKKKKKSNEKLLAWPILCNRRGNTGIRRNSSTFVHLGDGRYEVDRIPLEVAKVNRCSIATWCPLYSASRCGKDGVECISGEETVLNRLSTLIGTAG